jgi:hypothetical protein
MKRHNMFTRAKILFAGLALAISTGASAISVNPIYLQLAMDEAGIPGSADDIANILDSCSGATTVGGVTYGAVSQGEFCDLTMISQS